MLCSIAQMHTNTTITTTTNNNNNNNELELELEKQPNFCINDNMDLLVEILKRLDDRSLAVSACVCRLWCALTRNDSLWEHLCFRHLSPLPPLHGVRTVVAALGGYRRLYMLCVKPVVRRLGNLADGRLWTRHEVELALSLFCVDYYERVLMGPGPGTGARKLGGESASPRRRSCSCAKLSTFDFYTSTTSHCCY